MIPSDFFVQSPIDNYAKLCKKKTSGRSAQTLVLESSILTCCSLIHLLSFICVCTYTYIHMHKIHTKNKRKKRQICTYLCTPSESFITTLYVACQKERLDSEHSSCLCCTGQDMCRVATGFSEPP